MKHVHLGINVPPVAYLHQFHVLWEHTVMYQAVLVVLAVLRDSSAKTRLKRLKNALMEVTVWEVKVNVLCVLVDSGS